VNEMKEKTRDNTNEKKSARGSEHSTD